MDRMSLLCIQSHFIFPEISFCRWKSQGHVPKVKLHVSVLHDAGMDTKHVALGTIDTSQRTG